MTSEHAVVIVGAGPTGMMLAAELALADVDVVVIERRAGPELVGSRGGGLHARSLELLDQRGVVDRFLAAGRVAQVTGFAEVMLDIGDFPTRHPYGLALWQNQVERILAGWIGELGVSIRRQCEVTGLSQDGRRVDVSLATGEIVRGRWVVGCDGGRSVVRRAAGIDFPGWDATTSWLIAEVETTAEPALGMRKDALGSHGMGRLENGHTVRLVLTERECRAGVEPTMVDLRAALIAVYGTDFGVHDPTWLSRFSDVTRQAAAYRADRVLLAGDAAHVHPPIGGQGLNIGLHDAVNLGFKLAQVARGTSPESLLDTYHAERHPADARVLRTTMAQVALRRPDERSRAAIEAMAELLRMDEPRRHVAGLMSGLDVRYDLGAGHALLGRRMPDLEVRTADGPRRVFSFLHRARPLLLDLGVGVDVGPWRDRVTLVAATHDGPWELPVVGAVPAPRAVLVRPDGHVAWVGMGSQDGLREALVTWFGLATVPDRNS